MLNIQNEIIILPKRILLYSFQEEEPLGIEIIGQSYSQMLSQMFKIIWNQAEIVDDFGGEDFLML
ncbi:MAG: hypothetical protein ABFQ62_03005 [Patescibacteria group bacterium]